MEKQPLHPQITRDKVVNIADIRAQRLAALEVQQVDEATKAGQLPQFSTKETVWWRNQPFFALRLAQTEHGDFGRVSFKVGRLADGSRVMWFICDPYEAIYALSDDLTLAFDVDPLILRWSIPQLCDYPIVDKRNITFTEDLE